MKLPPYCNTNEPLLTSILIITQDSQKQHHHLPTIAHTKDPPAKQYLLQYIHPLPTHLIHQDFQTPPPPPPNPLPQYTPFPLKTTTIHPLRYPTSQSYYTCGSFTPLEIMNGNIDKPGVFNGPLQVHIIAKLSRCANILRAELYIFLAIEHTNTLITNTSFFTHSMNNIYHLLNHIRDPSSQDNHP